MISAEWLHEGPHIAAIGADLPGKQELGVRILVNADVMVCDTLEQCQIGGELQHMAASGVRRDVWTLGPLTSACRPYTRDQTAVTVCDLTGMGAQDTAIALEAYARIKKASIGQPFGL
jgi:ornithine cyclodeaminase